LANNHSTKQYAIVTGSYWAFTVTDGALRMLVVLFFHQLGYSPLEVAMLFLLYEFFGVVTNLAGGWLAARAGLNMTMHIGLALQIVALAMLLVDESLLTVAYVMVAQALSGVAKDLNKMSAKSSIKMLVADNHQGKLYKWIALLTGSKNALKGAGFFIGGVLLGALGFRGAIGSMVGVLVFVLVASYVLLEKDLGKTSFKPKFTDLLSSSGAVNRLSAARFFLFASRDVWFVVALPVFLQSQLGWSHVQVGGMLASWIILYGFVQASAPMITGIRKNAIPDGRTLVEWGVMLCLVPGVIALGLFLKWNAAYTLVAGLLLFALVFAINSSLHSYLIVAYAREEGVSLDVGFYYMANAAGRLGGTILSGVVYQLYGLTECLLVSLLLVCIASMLSIRLPRPGEHEADIHVK
jgi:predicted MFS family arabinose efflux permease